MTSAWSSRLGASVVLPAVLLAACTTTVTPVAMPEPVATTSAGAVEFYTAVQRDVLTALSAEFPGVRFEPKYASTTAGCTLPDGTSGLTVHLPIHGSGRPVPVDELDRAARVFEDTAARAASTVAMCCLRTPVSPSGCSRPTARTSPSAVTSPRPSDSPSVVTGSRPGCRLGSSERRPLGPS